MQVICPSIYAASETRAVDPEYASGFKTMFSDGYPFLLISQVSQMLTWSGT